MKLKPYQLCRWCDALWQGRRKWLTLSIAVFAHLLSLLLRLSWLFIPCLLLMAALVILYEVHLRHAFGANYQRPPRPQDALCETVLIDASLIGQGTRLRAAAQPIDVEESLHMRLGSGALLLGTAMTLTADELDAPDRSAILAAVQGLNIKPDRMHSQYPIMARELEGGVHRITVKDGMGQRRYYCGNPADVADLCNSIWEGHTRPMEDYDHLRIADAASYITQGQCRVLAYATALNNEDPIFLGLCGLGEEIDLSAVQDISALRAMGLTVMLTPGNSADTDLTPLHALLELPDFHARADIHLTPNTQQNDTTLSITRHKGESLQEPVHTLRARFLLMEDILRHYALYAGLPLVMGLLLASWSVSLCSSVMLLFAALLIGVDVNASSPRKLTLILLGVAAVLSKAILLTQTVPLAHLAGGLITIVTALSCAIKLCGSLFRWQGRCLVLPCMAIAYLLVHLLLTLSHGLALLLPLGFAALVSTIVWLVLIQTERHT